MRKWINLIERAMVPDTLDRKAVVAAVYQNLDWGGGSGASCIHDYIQENDIETDADDDWDSPLDIGEHVDHTTPEFKEWFAGWVENNYGDIEYDILDRVRDHKITLWRCISAPQDWTPEARHPGIYWSYDKGAEAAHWGKYESGYVDWVMQATVPIEAIDWLGTLTMAGQPDYHEEKEVRILPDFPVVIDKYWRQK